MNAASVLQFVAQRQQDNEANKRALAYQFKVPVPPMRLPKQSPISLDEDQGPKGNSGSASENTHARSQSRQSNGSNSRHRDAFDTDAEDLDDTSIISKVPSIMDPGHQHQGRETSSQIPSIRQLQNRRLSISHHALQSSKLSFADESALSDDCDANHNHSREDDTYGAAIDDVPPAEIVATNCPVPRSLKSRFEPHRMVLPLPSTNDSAQRGDAESQHSIDQSWPLSQGDIEIHDDQTLAIANHDLTLYRSDQMNWHSASEPQGPGHDDRCKRQNRLDVSVRTGIFAVSNLIAATASVPPPESLDSIRDRKPTQTIGGRNEHVSHLDAEADPEPSDLEGFPILAPLPMKESKPHKRTMGLDYSFDQLAQMTYQQLNDEPFDYVPKAPHNQFAISISIISSRSLKDMLNDLFSSHWNDHQGALRKAFFASLAIDQYEECGDLIIEKFSAVMSSFRKVRQQKRTAARTFEAEVERRQELVSKNKSKIEQYLKRMQQKGRDIVSKVPSA